MANFPTKPTLSQGESPSLFDIKFEDNVLKADSDGGYEFRRPRFTRPPRALLETGFKGIPHADYLILKSFYDTHLLSVAFNYFDYLHGAVRLVRFDEFKPEYVGVGETKLWDIKIKMSEV